MKFHVCNVIQGIHKIEQFINVDDHVDEVSLFP